MIPIRFKEQNTIYAENQPEYIPLPVHKDKSGVVTSCWGVSFPERLKILFGAKIYWQQLTFNNPLQPIKPTIGTFPSLAPEVKEKNYNQPPKGE